MPIPDRAMDIFAMFRLDDEKTEDSWEAEVLLDLAFGPGRKALSAYRLREGVAPAPDLSISARDEYESLSGVIRFWPVRIGVSAGLLLGPIAVHPTRQGEGLGALLIREGLRRAREKEWPLVILVGDLEYYGRFGFSKIGGIEFPPPTDPERVLGLELVEGAIAETKGKVGKWRLPALPA